MDPQLSYKATKLNLLRLDTIPVRTFWISSFAFFLCFFSWFGVIPFLPEIVNDLGMSPSDKWNATVLAVTGTVFARLVIGKLCDRYGPRLCYTGLLLLGSVPVILTGFAQTPAQFLICRFFTGFIGASFVITQVHTSLMFATNVVGTANATSAGWGNLGGGANRLGMPVFAGLILALGVSEAVVWRYSIVMAGCLCLLMGVVYYFFTKDTPAGNFNELPEQHIPRHKKDQVSWIEVIKDYRVWILFCVYACCFGIELTVYGTMDDYLQTTFHLDRITAGHIVLSFALMNLFARTLGGFLSDRLGTNRGLRGRVLFLAIVLLAEGLCLAIFSGIESFPIAILALILFSLAVQMAEGATFSVVPFISQKAIGTVSGLVGAGGNVGAFLAALLMKYKSGSAETNAIIANQGLSDEVMNAAQTAAASHAMSEGYLLIGGAVVVTGILATAIRFSPVEEHKMQKEMQRSMTFQQDRA